MPVHKLKSFLILITCFAAFSLQAKTVSDDREQKKKYQIRCQQIAKFLVQGRYKLDCHTNYHHYNSGAHSKYYRKTTARKAGQMNIAGYNLLYPGTNKSAFKDYALMAKLINRWDVVAALELLPVVGRDHKNNQNVVNFIENAPKQISEHESELSSLVDDKTEEALARKAFLKDKIEQLKSDLKEVGDLYRAPGYLKVFEELIKIDPSWSMILSPRGDAAEPTNVHELVGIFYRGSMAKPIINEHCEQFKLQTDGKPYACIPNFRKTFMGRETSHVFSRRPLLASFESGSFDFSVLASHVIYSSPDEREKMKSILMPSFGISDYEDLDAGATKLNYARIAEMKVTLELMEKLRKRYDEQDIILVSDTNLTPNNPYWDSLLEEFSGSELLIEDPTSLTQARFDSDGEPTGGYSSSYDHFVIDSNHSSECVDDDGFYNIGRTGYFSGEIQSYITRHYIVRAEDKVAVDNLVEKKRYRLTAVGKTRMQKKLKAYRTEIEKVKTIKNGRIVYDNYKIDERVKAFEERVFMQQLADRTYYRVYSEVLSDHFPINLTCFNSQSFD